jgi:hypothetical protein
MHLVPTYSVLINWERVGDEKTGGGGGSKGGIGLWRDGWPLRRFRLESMAGLALIPYRKCHHAVNFFSHLDIDCNL